MSNHNGTFFQLWKHLSAIWSLNTVFWSLGELSEMSDLTCFSRRCIAGAKWLPFRLSLSMQSVHVKPHIHRFQHGSLCLCLHHLIASVLVSCFCNFRQPAGSFHLLNWSRLPVLKLVSCFLESRLFSSHLFFFVGGLCSSFAPQCLCEAARGQQLSSDGSIIHCYCYLKIKYWYISAA